MLVEQLRYTLHNLDLSNMNAAAVNQWEETITEPLYVRIEGTEGQITQLAITQVRHGRADQRRGGEHHRPSGHGPGAGHQDHQRRGRDRVPAGDGQRSIFHRGEPGGADLQPDADGEQLLPLGIQREQQLHHLSGGRRNHHRQRPGDVHRHGDVRGSEDSGATTINGDNITTGTIYADFIHLGGQMDVYRTSDGFSLGGYIGYMSGRTATGSTTSGIAIASQNEGGGGYLHHQRRPEWDTEAFLRWYAPELRSPYPRITAFGSPGTPCTSTESQPPPATRG